MKLIFIRHGEPDYNTDSLTDNGKIEAELLSKRVMNWNVSEFFVSPQGRALETAKPSLSACGRVATQCDFLHEFSYPIDDPITGRHGVPWDFVPSDVTSRSYNFELEDGFLKNPVLQKNPEIYEKYPEVIKGLDSIIEKYGYQRSGMIYLRKDGRQRFLKSTVGNGNSIQDNGPKDENETVLVFFCHLGITCLMLSHLLNIPFEPLVHGVFLPTTSVTVVSTEERWENQVSFRIELLGCTKHLEKGGQPISPAGFFATPFRENH